MKLTEGVYLHFIKAKQFKTQRIKIRFSAPMTKNQLAGRVLLANMLEVANKVYPTARSFRQKLASLYGANFSTSLGKKGLVHTVDLDISFLSADFLSGKDLTLDALDFLKASLFHPLTQADSFDEDLFKIEQKNVLHYLETEIEDNFYEADQMIDQLFYQKEDLSLPYLGTLDLIRSETPQATFRTFQKMLAGNQVDIFCLGVFNEAEVSDYFKKFELAPRQIQLDIIAEQAFSTIIREKIEKKPTNQSILQIAYHVPVTYGSQDYFTLLVLNSLLGDSPQSKLFVNIREKTGLVYTIGSEIDSLTGYLKIYAGIDRDKRNLMMTLIRRQWSGLQRGQFTVEELSHVKDLIKSKCLLRQDRQIGLIEEAYGLQVFGDDYLKIDDLLTGVYKVSKKDVMELARQVKLQALYFMEGDK